MIAIPTINKIKDENLTDTIEIYKTEKLDTLHLIISDEQDETYYIDRMKKIQEKGDMKFILTLQGKNPVEGVKRYRNFSDTFIVPFGLFDSSCTFDDFIDYMKKEKLKICVAFTPKLMFFSFAEYLSKVDLIVVTEIQPFSYVFPTDLSQSMHNLHTLFSFRKNEHLHYQLFAEGEIDGNKTFELKQYADGVIVDSCFALDDMKKLDLAVYKVKLHL